jgi:hypothetical protein
LTKETLKIIYQTDFKNIGNIPFYEDLEKKKKLIQLEKNGQTSTLIPLLENYVSQFGIQNFVDQQDYIWKLAQLLAKIFFLPKVRFFFKKNLLLNF